MNPVEGIIARLTEEEREKLRDGRWNIYSAFFGFEHLGLLERLPGVTRNCQLTPLGLAVKAALEDPSHAD